MKRVFSIGVPLAIIVGLIALFWYLLDGKQIPVLQPSGEVAIAQRNLIIFTTALSLIVVVPVFTLLAFITVKYRASNKAAKYEPEWGENRVLEGLWWGIPIFIIGILGIVIVQTSHSLDPYKQLSGGEPLEVQVVALQWKWLFIYPEQQIATINHIAIPLNRPVHFSLAADAPMSAFWIPALGSQVYAMNGMESQLSLKATKIGQYTGYTTNINGEGYSKMTFTTNVLSQADYDSWVATTASSTMAMDKAIYDKFAKPSSNQDESAYRLTDPKLFETVVNKYGHSHKVHEGHES